jgi:hypothetical protein
VAPNEFGGGVATIFMVLPFLFIIAGLAYIALAAGDRHKRRQRQSVRVLPVGAEHPLSHLRTKMNPVPQAKRSPDQKAGQRRRSEPPWLTKV